MSGDPGQYADEPKGDAPLDVNDGLAILTSLLATFDALLVLIEKDEALGKSSKYRRTLNEIQNANSTLLDRLKKKLDG